jgi:glutathione S-transferase
MRLLGTATSPYVRKIRVAAAELGIADRVTFETIVFANAPPDLAANNPLRKVPTLITDDGMGIFDSPVILDYLDVEHGRNKLLPPSGKKRWIALTASAVADGILEAGGMIRTERAKKEPEQNAASIEKQLLKVNGSLDYLEQNRAWREPASPDLGQICAAVAVGWLYFRLADLIQPLRWPTLIAWYQEFAKRPSMVSTAPSAT